MIESPSDHTERDRNHAETAYRYGSRTAAEPRKDIRSPQGQAAQKGGQAEDR